MNWPELNEMYHRTSSREMSPKEASDSISQIWYLLRLSALHNLAHTEFLLDLTIALCNVQDNNWQQRWADSIPTDMKAVEMLKKILQERGIKTS